MRFRILTGLSALLLAACSQTTDIADYEEANRQSNTISIQCSSPDAFQFPATRVDEGLQLRYVAKLWSGNAIAANQLKARKELVAKDGNVITFEAEPGAYTVAVFADYISADATADANGKYPDKFYDTSSKGDYIEMRAFRDNETKDKLEDPALTNINNDNYDCFAAKGSFTKEALEYNGKLTLTRAVAKVRVVDNGGDFTGVDKVQITQFSFGWQYSFVSEKSNVGNSFTFSTTPIELEPSSKTDRELFYFYTFGTTSKGDLKDIQFKITGQTNYVFNSGNAYSLGSNNWKALSKNTIYKATGNFLTPSTAPSNVIKLTLDSNQDWGPEANAQQ